MTALFKHNTAGTALIAISTVYVMLDILTVGLTLWALRIKNDDWVIISLVEKVCSMLTHSKSTDGKANFYGRALCM